MSYTNTYINEVIKNIKERETHTNFLRLIAIGMIKFYNDISIINLINKVEIVEELPSYKNITINNRSTSTIIKNKLYINLNYDLTDLETLETLTYEINYFYNNNNKSVLSGYFNILQTEDIIKNIIKVTDLINNINIKNLYNKLSLDKNYKCYIDQANVNLIRPLYKINKNYNKYINTEFFIRINNLFERTLTIESDFEKAEYYRNIKEIIKKETRTS